MTGVDFLKLGDLVHELSHKMSAELIFQEARNILRISFFVTFFSINIIGLFIVHMIVSLSLRCVHKKTFRRVQRFFEALFVRLLLSLILLIAGNEIILCIPETESGHYTNVKLTEMKFSKMFHDAEQELDDGSISRDLIMSNHQIYSDWIYLWSLMDKIDRAGELKIIMKRSLRKVPILGWSMRFFDFVFLNRKWEQDQDHFRKKLKGFVESESPFVLLIFPEGTTLNNAALAKSESFAANLGVKSTSRVLLPRVLGMWEAVKALDPALDGIYDLTVGYSGLKETDEPEKVYTLGQLFYNGNAPKQVHYHVSYIPVKEIPRTSADEFGEWLRDRFYEKDRLLDEFYQTGQFPNSKSIKKPLCPKYYVLKSVFLTIFCLASFYAWYFLIFKLVAPGLFVLIRGLMKG